MHSLPTVIVSFEAIQHDQEANQAGHGAHVRWGPKGLPANHGAVAEQGELVGPNPGENRAGT